MEPGADGITLQLHAKEGSEIDATEIEKCLDYTVSKISSEPSDS